MAVEKNNVVAIEHRFKESPARVFKAVMEGRLFFNCGAWPQHSEVDFRVGGKYRIWWGADTTGVGEFLEIVPDRRVAFTWNWDGEAMNTRVTIDLSPDGPSGCLAKLRHEGFEDEETAKAHEGGWCGGLADMQKEIEQNQIHIDREYKMSVAELYECVKSLPYFKEAGIDPAKASFDKQAGGKFTGKLGKGAVTLELGPWGDDKKSAYLDVLQEGLPSEDEMRAYHKNWNLMLDEIRKKGSAA